MENLQIFSCDQRFVELNILIFRLTFYKLKCRKDKQKITIL